MEMVLKYYLDDYFCCVYNYRDDNRDDNNVKANDTKTSLFLYKCTLYDHQSNPRWCKQNIIRS
jgi:hypothetical protein